MMDDENGNNGLCEKKLNQTWRVIERISKLIPDMYIEMSVQDFHFKWEQIDSWAELTADEHLLREGSLEQKSHYGDT